MPQDWSQTSKLVADRVRRGKQTQRAIARVAKHLPPLQSGYGQIFWHPKDHALWLVTGDGDEYSVCHKWSNALKGVHGVEAFRAEAEYFPPNRDDWVLIKKAEGPLEWLRKPFEWSGKLTGGPTPLSNAIAGGLLAGGVGYGVGAIGDALSPHDYIEPGAGRRSLGLLGLGLGATPGLLQGLGIHNLSTEAKQPLGLRSWLTKDEDVPISPSMRAWQNAQDMSHLGGQPPEGVKLSSDLSALGRALTGVRADTRLVELVKIAAESLSGAFSSAMRPVRVDAFNNAIWHDVSLGVHTQNQDHTPPYVGAAASGLISGVQQMYGGASLLSPMHFIKGLAAAGVDATTAHVAGGTLGALGILTPKAQQQLQTMGVWGGLVRGVTGSLLGLY